MAYTSSDRFITVFGSRELEQLIDRDNTGKLDDEVFDAAAADADALINGYLSDCFVTPFLAPRVPLLVISVADKLTRYNLYAVSPTEEVTEMFEQAMKMLEHIKDGQLVLIDPTTSLPIDPLIGLGTMNIIPLIRA